jgi:hypothetical protein
MAKIQKITTAEISAIITETFESEEAAAGDAKPTETDVEISSIKTDHINWKKVKDE